ncbi:MAG: DUF721 domain-containing protein [Burkholderiales bacterium]|nr:DUF721 domain-containing protein [Burkholderiales bacterium]
MTARKFHALIGNTPGLSTLNQAMQRIAALQRHYEACAPTDLVHATRVVGDRNGTLVIAADNGAVAAKLRQGLPRLLKNLQKQSAQVKGIQVQVQVKSSPPKAPARPEKKTLPIDLIDNFSRLSEQVRDPGLSAALARFAARRRAKG